MTTGSSYSSQVKTLPEARERLAGYEDRIQNLETCVKISSLLTSELDLDVLLDVIMTTAKKIMRADACSLLLVDEETGDLVFQVALSEVGPQVKTAGRIKMGEGIAGSVAKTGRPVVIQNAYDHPRFNPEFDRKTGFKTGSILCAPLRRAKKIIGVCQVIHSASKGRAFSDNDLPLFRMVCDSSALAIQNALSVQAIVKTQEMEKDMEFARRVQEGFLPKSPPLLDSFSFAAKTVPGNIVGSDFYDFIPLDSKRMAVVIADISGKGVAAALHMARLTSDFRFVSQAVGDPAEVLKRINNILCERSGGNVYTTALYAALDSKKKKLTLANSGHPSPIFQRRGKLIAGEAKASGAPLGIMPNIQYKQIEISLEPGDRIFLYTDGILKVKNKNAVSFGLDRLCDILKNDDGRSPDSLTLNLGKTVQKFAGNTPQEDDWTFLTIQTL